MFTTARYTHVIIALALGCTIACSDDSIEVGPEPSDVGTVAFAPDPFYPEGDVDADLLVGEDAVLLATVAIEGGEIRFLDETPSAAQPSISIVVIEPDQTESVLDVARFQNASPLELFLTVAPSEPAPAELERDHKLMFAERGLEQEPRRLDPEVVPRSFEDDDWGPLCRNTANWASGFNTWSAAAAARAHMVFYYPNYGPNTDVYGYFSTNDYIWAGVCIREFGWNLHPVEMQVWNGTSYQLISGSSTLVPIKDRYLYYSFSLNSAARRIRVAYKGPKDEFLVSGGWKDSLPKAP